MRVSCCHLGGIYVGLLHVDLARHLDDVCLVYQTEKDGGKMWKDIGVFIRVDFYIIHGFLSRGVTELYISIFINIIDNIDLIHIP